MFGDNKNGIRFEDIEIKFNNCGVRDTCQGCEHSMKPGVGLWSFLKDSFAPICLACMETMGANAEHLLLLNAVSVGVTKEEHEEFMKSDGAV